MILVQEKVLKVAGKYIPGQVTEISVTESGIIEDKKNKKGKVVKANQPKGYEASKVEFALLFEESSDYSALDMVQYVQRIFKKSGQKKQKKYRIVEPHVNARGISEVYFNDFTTKESFDTRSGIEGTLSFVAPKIGGVKVVKTKKQKAAEKAKAAKKAAKTKASEAKKKTTKNLTDNPAKDLADKKNAKNKAKSLVK